MVLEDRPERPSAAPTAPKKSKKQRPLNYDVSSKAAGYRVEDKATVTDTGLSIQLVLNEDTVSPTSVYGKPVEKLHVSVDYETQDRIHIKIEDVAGKHVAVPDSPLGLERPRAHAATLDANYDFQFTHAPFGFAVIRKSDGATVFDTRSFPLVFEDQYLEVSTEVPETTNIYGFGETALPHFKRNSTKDATTIFTRDMATPFYENVYGAHPFHMEIREGKAHGVFLLNAHGMDVFSVTGRITWKIIGGVLEFYIFVPDDHKPNSVSRAYTDLIGKPMMPALWMLGWQQCRWGYEDLAELEGVVEKYKAHNIPLEVVWIDIDYMDGFKDFTLDPVRFPEDKVKAFVDKLHADKQRLIVIVDAGKAYQSTYPAYQRGHELDVFLKNPDGSECVGQVWPGYTVFPDWWHPNAQKYWDHEIGDWMTRLHLDGLWIDMDEPACFGLGSHGSGKIDVTLDCLEPWTLPETVQDKMHAEQKAALDALAEEAKTLLPHEKRNLLYPPYAINNGHGDLSEKTMPMTAQHYGGIAHYDLHSLYGHAECYTTRQSLLKHKPNERPFILSRSTFAGSGQYAGHWAGDNHSSWEYLKSSVTELLNISMFGITYCGVDICGFLEDATEELCVRWQEIGAFYPFARNHNCKGQTLQEPYLFKSTTEATIKALNVRYALLPYYYTLHEESHRLGTTVWRPLVFEYPEIEAFANSDTQVLIGTDILLSPVLDPGETSVVAQVPPGIWYDYYTHEPVQGGTQSTLDAPLTHIPVHVRGGAIVPLKTPKLLVEDTYATPYTLLVALDEFGKAQGRLYIDDGHSIHGASSDITFSFENNILQAKGNFDYAQPEMIAAIQFVSPTQDHPLVGKKAVVNSNGETLEITPDTSYTAGSTVMVAASIPLMRGFKITFS